MPGKVILLIVSLLVGIAAALAVGAVVVGLYSIERHRGFFAPVWSEDGEYIYFVERETRGRVLGLGWEFFTPPARVHVDSDRIRLRRLRVHGMHIQDGEFETLIENKATPLENRDIRTYRGRIFTVIRAMIEPHGETVTYRLRISVPRVPTSEEWTLEETWPQSSGMNAEWQMDRPAQFGYTANVLREGRELMTIPGPEGFPSAIVVVHADGRVEVLVQSDAFREAYPAGVPERLILERSRREDIERLRTLRETRAELVARFRSELEAMGLLPRSPKMVATEIAFAPDHLRVFAIPEQRFSVGLFQDIAAAIETPGREVDTSTGTYLKYADDDLGVRLRDWRKEGHDRFVVQTGGRMFLIEVRRFDQAAP